MFQVMPKIEHLLLNADRWLFEPAGTFMAGSIRWERVSSLEVRFNIVTYWTRSFSVYNNPYVGQPNLISISAQNTVQFDPGDGSAPQTLKANVTDVSIEEDWFSAVTVLYHTYPQVFINAGWISSLLSIARVKMNLSVNCETALAKQCSDPGLFQYLWWSTGKLSCICTWIVLFRRSHLSPSCNFLSANENYHGFAKDLCPHSMTPIPRLLALPLRRPFLSALHFAKHPLDGVPHRLLPLQHVGGCRLYIHIHIYI